ncbi:MAG: hypothetical protein AAAB35_17875 [Phyllobacterium sp.]|uniref:hypothetical protein n=1 Tax=Phyllobacterium sp. TaxID=1871046 RepID=UPI0030F27242
MLAAFKYWQIGEAALLGALIAAGPIYLYGASQGRQQAAVEAVKETAQAYQERATTNATINSLDAVALCVELGGLPDECQRLRGLAEDTGQTGDGSAARDMQSQNAAAQRVQINLGGTFLRLSTFLAMEENAFRPHDIAPARQRTRDYRYS